MTANQEQKMTTHIVYQGPVTVLGARNASTLIIDAYRKGTQELTLSIASGGGDVTAGMGLYNFIRAMPITINTHVIGMCGSIAATVLLAGERRTSSSASLFTLHASSYVDGPRAGQVAESTQIIALPFRQRANWTDEQVSRFFSSALEQSFLPQHAQELGMIHEVVDISFAQGDEIMTVAIPT
ncbi:ATP-dependent Clp protease proteolytic subunit [Cupriavidus sp. USMAA2-4]|uniref:ATP-dependent Clp protease proteolytic subunit n=1 Tax=Cupriavidus sp. USMAA2-4 TaxID=876364 RepID=UPI0012F48FC8|nr:ATP-dependent Clp protease proteolytic subunit [Cupriavidus sp. USMAA2-4]